MKYSCYSFRRKLLVTAVSLVLPAMVLAEPSNADLQQQIDALQNQVTAPSRERQTLPAVMVFYRNQTVY